MFRKKLSLICGTLGLMILQLLYFDILSINMNIIILVLFLLSIMHFYYMELDFKSQLQVRPFGYLAFILPSIAIMARLFF